MNDDMKKQMENWKAEITFGEICNDPKAKVLVVECLKRNDCGNIADRLCSSDAKFWSLMDNMGGGISAKALQGIAETLDTYYSVDDVIYYWLNDCDMVGKRINSEDYIYRDGYWQIDFDWMIHGRLGGFDPTADADDIYGYGCTDIMNTIEVITEEEATERIKCNSK